MMNAYLEDFHQEPVEPNKTYEFRVNGRLSQDMAAWFDDMTLILDEGIEPPQTIIRGKVRDQAALYGLISRIRDLGLSLLSVNQQEQKEEK